MLNASLPIAKLHEDLKIYLKSWKWILNQIQPEKEIPLLNDKELLGKLHHALNISKYSQREFREELLFSATPEQIRKFAEKCNIPNTVIKPNDNEFRKQLSKYKWQNDDKTKNFIEVFEYPSYLMPNQKPMHNSEIEHIEKNNNPYKALKDYQFDIFFKVEKRIEEIPYYKALIQMPTGSGKTRVAMEIVSTFLNNSPNRQVIWLADRAELCEQAVESFLNSWKHSGKYDLNLYRLWGDSKIPDKIQGTCFIVSMYQKLRKSIRDDKYIIKADLIIADEAHNILAPTYETTVESFVGPEKQTRILGLSATPSRGNNEVESKKLALFFNDTIFPVQSGELGPIIYLQNKGILSKCIRKPIFTNIKFKITPEEWKKLEKTYDIEYPPGLVKRIAMDEARNLIITKKLLDLAKECKHVLVFGASVEQSKLLCGILIAFGYNAVHVDGDTQADYRKDVVKKFKNGTIQFIFNYGVFVAGFDAPNIDAVLIARPTTSTVLYGQMIGRGLRGPNIGGTKEFQLVDIVDNIITEQSGLDSVFDHFLDYWD